MCENVEPNWEEMYRELLEQVESLKCENAEVRAKANYYEVENLKYKTVISAMEFALGRKFSW